LYALRSAGKQGVIVVDEFQPQLTTTAVVWAMHTHAAVVISEATASLSAGKKTITVRVIEPADASTYRLSAVPLNVYNDKNYPDPGLQRIQVELNTGPTRIVVQISDGLPQVDSVNPLASWAVDGPLRQ
jgi:hypothetical protein